MKSFKNFICAVILGITIWGTSISPVSACNGCVIQPADENQYIKNGRISLISYDLISQEYVAIANTFDGNRPYVFTLDIKAPYNELVEESLNKMLNGCLVQMTLDDDGNGRDENDLNSDDNDDFVWRAIF